MAEGFKDRYNEFMVGRNGGDAISRVCLIVAIVLLVLSFFCVGINPFLYVLVLLLGIAAGAYAVLRMISRKVMVRQAENAAFLSMFQNILNREGGEGEDGEEEPRSSRRPRRERPSDIPDAPAPARPDAPRVHLRYASL
jgi:hypothetical protein